MIEKIMLKSMKNQKSLIVFTVKANTVRMNFHQVSLQEIMLYHLILVQDKNYTILCLHVLTVIPRSMIIFQIRIFSIVYLTETNNLN